MRTTWILPFIALVGLSVGCASQQSASGDNGKYTDLDEDYAPNPDFIVRSMDIMSSAAGKVGNFVAAGPTAVWKFARAEKASDAALEMDNSNSADARQHGINELVSHKWAQTAPFTNRYRQIGLLDPDPLVRGVAIRALNRSRDVNSVAVWRQALADPSPRVRLEAAKAFVHIPDPDSAPVLGQMVGDKTEDRDVRIAAADALQHYKTLNTARQLSVALDERDFAIAWQSRRSLRILTGKDFGYDQSAWLDYFTGPDKPF